MLSAGFSRVDLHVAPGVDLCGYGPYLDRGAELTHDELFARALLLEDDGGGRVLLIQLDLPGLDKAQLRDCIEGAAEGSGLPEEVILVTCSHTHSAPATLTTNGYGRPDPAFLSVLRPVCERAAREALADLEPVRSGLGHSELRAVGFNRVRADGPYFPNLDVLRLDTADGRAKVVVYCHGCHPVTLDVRGEAGKAASADYPGWVAERVSEETGAEAVFVLGPCGDVDPVVAWRRFDYQGRAVIGEIVTQGVLALAETITTETELHLRLERRSFELPLRRIDSAEVASEYEAGIRAAEALGDGEDDHREGWLRFWSTWFEGMRDQSDRDPDPIEVEVAILRFSDEVAWVFLPGEVFGTLGEEVRRRSPFPHTIVSTLLGRYVGYIPDEVEMSAGGYASAEVPRVLVRPPYAPGVGPLLVEEAVALLERAAGPATAKPSKTTNVSATGRKR